MILKALRAAAMAAVVFPPFQATAGEDPVVAVVNDVEIRRSEIDEAETRLPARFKDYPPEAVYGLLVNSLVDTHLMAAEARKQSLHEDKIYKQQLSRIERQLLERIMLKQHLKAGMTEEALKRRYAKFVEESSGKEEVRASHILVDSEDKAKDIIAKLKAGGDFAKLAKEHSMDPSAGDGGDLGYFSDRQMVPEFAAAAFGLAKGAHTGAPVKTQFGWHIIKAEDRRTGKTPSFEDAKDELKSLMSNELGRDLITGLRGNAKITMFKPDGSPMEDHGKPK